MLKDAAREGSILFLEYVYFWLMLRFRENFRLCLEIE